MVPDKQISVNDRTLDRWQLAAAVHGSSTVTCLSSMSTKARE